jgi:kynureninase
MMVSFYRSSMDRYKILMENNAFPSDRYCVDSQVKFHGRDPQEAVLELRPTEGRISVEENEILESIEKNKKDLSLILLGNVNYLSGQAFNMEEITRLAHRHGIAVGFDLAHGAGNLLLNLHDAGVDFAVWCCYKYLNSGPGALGGCFVHEKHHGESLPRFEGWFGNRKETRFLMDKKFDPVPTASGWKISNPAIFQLAAMRASMDIFDRATMETIRKVGDDLTGYLEGLLKEKCPEVEVVTPKKRGSMLSVKYKGDSEGLLRHLRRNQAEVDFRPPDIFRMTPAPLYNTYEEVFNLAQLISRYSP